MKKLTTSGTGLLLCAIVLLHACKKEASNFKPAEQPLRAAGAVANDPTLVAKVPVIISSEFTYNAVALEASSNSRKKPPTSSTDITSPTIIISSPVNGSTVEGTVSVSINASDNVGVKSVSLSVDGTSIGTASTAPYNFSWNTSTLSDGTHSLTARATDAAGNSARSRLLGGLRR